MRVIFLTAVLALAASAGPARAAFIRSMDIGPVTAGGTTTFRVLAHSNEVGGESLDMFGLGIQIYQVSGTGTLRFVNPQSSAELSDPDYVFDPLDSVNGLLGPPSSLVSTDVTPNDTYVGGDSTLSNAGVMVGGTDKLLAIIELDATAATAGDVYEVYFMAQPKGNPGTNFFLDPNGNAYSMDKSRASTIEIQAGVNAVPAPAGLLLGLIGAGCLGGVRLLRRSRK